jgi:deleted-in-malignant-brain-tumors protein 1
VSLLITFFYTLASSTEDIRLADGTTSNEGRVEILIRGVWGTVCNSDWDMRDANVVCRMLNYKGAISARENFGPGTGPIWLTRLSCVGYERNIVNCTHDGLGQTSSCSHGNDAGVVCHSYSG